MSYSLGGSLTHLATAFAACTALLGFAIPASVIAAETVEDAWHALEAGEYEVSLSRTSRLPASSEADLIAGVALALTNRLTEAEDTLRGAYQRYPTDAFIAANYAWVLNTNGKSLEARHLLESFLDNRSDTQPAYRMLKQVYGQLARDSYARVASAAPLPPLPLAAPLLPPGRTANIKLPTMVLSRATAASQATVTEESSSPRGVTESKSRPPSPQISLDRAPQAQAATARDPARHAQDSGTLVDLTKAWAQAWASKSLTEYFGYYSPVYPRGDQAGNDQWRRERRSRIDRPGEILIALEDIRVEAEGDRWRVSFRQRYRSPYLVSVADKALVWEKRADSWTIFAERVLLERLSR